MNYRLVVPSLLLLSLYACRPVNKVKCGEVKCMEVGLKMLLQGYPDSAFETMYLNTYAANNDFATPTSGRTLHIEDAPINEQRGDMSRLITGLNMEEGYDYELILATTHDTFRVWDLKNPADTIKRVCDAHGCYSFVRSCQTNKATAHWTITPTRNSQDLSVLFYK